MVARGCLGGVLIPVTVIAGVLTSPDETVRAIDRLSRWLGLSAGRPALSEDVCEEVIGEGCGVVYESRVEDGGAENLVELVLGDLYRLAVEARKQKGAGVVDDGVLRSLVVGEKGGVVEVNLVSIGMDDGGVEIMKMQGLGVGGELDEDSIWKMVEGELGLEGRIDGVMVVSGGSVGEMQELVFPGGVEPVVEVASNPNKLKALWGLRDLFLDRNGRFERFEQGDFGMEVVGEGVWLGVILDHVEGFLSLGAMISVVEEVDGFWDGEANQAWVEKVKSGEWVEVR